MWIILIDHINDVLAGEQSRIGVGKYPGLGEKSVNQIVNDHCWSYAFRILDADRVTYYEGLTNYVGNGEVNTDALCAALEFGKHDAGGTDIEYRRVDEDEWHPL